MQAKLVAVATAALAAVLLAAVPGRAPAAAPGAQLDDRVEKFLAAHRWSWRDMNVSEGDGRVLFDLIVERGYKRALEVGTSTGHSGTWIAWALNRTGGRLITLEIERDRHEEAVANFREAGLDGLIDARLGDAHEIVPKLEGPFDLVFLDADKEWNARYAEMVLGKLAPGGCIAVHNIHGRGRGWTAEYWDFVKSRPELETSVEPAAPGGIVLSFRK